MIMLLCDCDEDDAASLAWVGNSTCAKKPLVTIYIEKKFKGFYVIHWDYFAKVSCLCKYSSSSFCIITEKSWRSGEKFLTEGELERWLGTDSLITFIFW